MEEKDEALVRIYEKSLPSGTSIMIRLWRLSRELHNFYAVLIG